jgi:ATP-dependent RNA helicase DDX35
VLMLHAGVTQEVQEKVFAQETDGRKIILATNVAESSITIPDVDFVVDTGYVKCKVYDQQTGIDKMVVIPCGKHSCEQRAGRAGRVSNGYCYRIFTEDAYNRMP